MQLRYRGIAYKYNPVQIEMIETKTTASFRGLSYRVRRCTNLYIPQTMRLMKLRYRGVSYIKGQAGTTTSSTRQPISINPATS